MELLYIWINNYKNIEKQGFNFSPEYSFVYDEKKQIINCNYKNSNLKKIFGKRIINITGIIGKNGAGKSNILEFYCNHLTIINDIFKKRKDIKKDILIFKNADDILIYTHNKVYITNSQNEINLKEINGFSYDEQSHFSQYIVPIFFSTNYDERSLFPDLSRFELINISNYRLLFEDNQQHDIDEKNKEPFKKIEQNISLHKIKETKRILRFISENKEKNHIDFGFPLRNYIYISINQKLTSSLKYKQLFNKFYTYFEKQQNNSSNLFFKGMLVISLLEKFIFFGKDPDEIYKELTRNDVKLTIRLGRLNKLIPNLNKEERKEIADLVSKTPYGEDEQKLYNHIWDKLYDIEFNEVFDKTNFFEQAKTYLSNHQLNKPAKEGEIFGKKIITENYKVREIIELIDFIKGINDNQLQSNKSKEQSWIIKDYLRNKTFNPHSFILELDCSLRFLNLYSKAISGNSNLISDFLYFRYPDMSTGELQFLTIFSRLHFAKNILDNYDRNSGVRNVDFNDIILFLDEGETYFHPQWQKSYLDKIINTVPNLFPEYNIQIVLTSHSPYIASDLPKDHIIFLDVYNENSSEVKKDIQKTGNCKVRDKNIQEDTFGANIHMLLANSFFLQNGFIGDFARDKIQIAIDYINGKNKKYSKETVFEIINAIGEKFIKNQLLKQFENKVGFNKEQRIELLKQELKKLENDKNF